MEQQLFTLPEHKISPPVFSWNHVTRSLVLYVCFVDRCLSFCTLSYCTFSFGCSSSIYGFWFTLALWYLQTLPRHPPQQSNEWSPIKIIITRAIVCITISWLEVISRTTFAAIIRLRGVTLSCSGMDSFTTACSTGWPFTPCTPVTIN